MTFDLSASSAGSRSSFDSGPLSWVMDEIREALSQSRAALQNAVGKDIDAAATPLNHAIAYLHQAHGALQIVDVDGATILTEAIEDILRRIVAEESSLSRSTQRTIEQSYQALIEYLEELLAGVQPQPIRLFPYYKDLQQLRGADRIHPADLFFPALDEHMQYAPAAETTPDAAALNATSLRRRFEKALLKLLTSQGSPAETEGIEDLQRVVADIEQAQGIGKPRDFWWVMHAFIDSVVTSQEPISLFVKQVCGRMNRQIKLLAQGSANVSDRLLLDALYCAERELPASSHLERVRDAYQLRTLVPADFEVKRYGLIDTVTLGLAKSALSQAKNTWHRVTKSEAGAAESFALLLRQLVTASGKLNSPPLVDLLKSVSATAEQLPQAANAKDIGLEIATDLLFIENTLDHLNRVHDDFPQRVASLIDRLNALSAGESLPESAPWLDDLTQQSQQKQTASVLSSEMESGLRRVEELLNDFFSDSTKHSALAQIDPILHQIAGVLSIMGQEDAMLAVQHTQTSIQQYKSAIEAAGGDAGGLEFPPSVTQNITALGFFVEVLPQHPESARTRFTFDRTQGILHANLLERGVPRPAALTTADPAFDPLLDIEDGASAQSAAPMPVAAATMPDSSAPLPETDEEIDAELLDIFMSEAEDVLAFVKENLPDAREHASDQDRLSTLRRSFHTLKGSGRMVGLTAFAEAAYSIEKVMNQWLAEAKTATPELFSLLDVSVDELGKWVADLREGGKSSRSPIPLSEAAERVKLGEPFSLDETPMPTEAVVVPLLATQPEPVATIIPVAEVPPLTAGSSNVIEFPVAAATEPATSDTVKRIGSLEISVPLFNIYIAEADDLLRHLTQDLSEWRHEPDRPVSAKAIHSAHSLGGSSATVGLRAIQAVAHALESYLQTIEQQPKALDAGEFDALQHCLDQIRLMLQQVALSELPDAQPEVLQLLSTMQQAAATAPTLLEPEALNAAAIVPDSADEDEDESALAIKDSLDPDLLPVFLDEGRDLLPAIGEALRGWTNDPADNSPIHDILRHLHTAKGSARMAGAMTLGQLLHQMETQIEHIQNHGAASPALLDDLLARYDYGMQLFDHLQNPDQEKPAPLQPLEPELEQTATSLPEPFVVEPQAEAKPAAAPTTTAKPGSQAPVARVRVRADILDRLVNQAGEVSIARSKIENEVTTLKQSLGDLTENLSRLRAQLREVEIQAESQITSRQAHNADREFDPLEFDRFSRLQELTRMMTESVDDVASIQDSLVRTVSGATSDLENQAQLTRALQQDLMQVRMVPFASISERLYQVTRQAAKEMGKGVNLDIKGTSVEVDRGVLERMAGPLEHLLRNAVVHGIGSRDERKALGKNETGELLVEIRQEGNEVVIQIADDGRGLDHARIREKAISAGLIAADRELSDAELENLIFQSGFTTAGEVTSLAGRGVGLDVVRAEAASLGGRVNVHSESGKGTRFTVNLPLTLAVTSVVLLQSGVTIYAVPSVLVEQVQQLTQKALASVYAEGGVSWQGSVTPVHFLSTLLGDTQAAPLVQQYSPVLVLRSGTDRVAIHVDEVVGNREVVVKNIGPQLARMVGIVGATVLGSGNIVLILDPVALAQRAIKDGSAGVQRMKPATPLPVTEIPADGAVAANVTGDADTEQPGMRKRNIVMVVDDSLTVRRVTQRFLQREGYQVVLAKDGVDALEKLQEVKPDVMLVDIEMPRMDGFDLIRNVRSDNRIAKTPIIMITSRTASKHRNYAMELGANEYYGKPFQEQQLLESIEEFVGKDGVIKDVEPTS